jgi:hypothetical protein
MASLLKKKADNAGPVVPPWHPDLRIVDLLPDTKVVRTAFFVNGIAILGAVVLALLVVHREWELHVVNGQIADAQKQIDRDKRPSAQAVQLFGKFKQEESRIRELNEFVSSRPNLSPIILRIAETLPAKLALRSLDFGPAGLTLKAIIRGAPDQASGDASAYLDQVKADPELTKYFDEMALNSLSRDPATNRLTVELFLKFKGVKKS